jgi:hypothetical protein
MKLEKKSHIIFGQMNLTCNYTYNKSKCINSFVV